MDKREVNKVASAIVKRLFTNGSGEKADRLVLTKDGVNNDRDLGGWSQQGALSQIINVLLTPPTEQGE